MLNLPKMVASVDSFTIIVRPALIAVETWTVWILERMDIQLLFAMIMFQAFLVTTISFNSLLRMLG